VWNGERYYCISTRDYRGVEAGNEITFNYELQPKYMLQRVDGVDACQETESMHAGCWRKEHYFYHQIFLLEFSALLAYN
jgi:hypothetical protein